MLELDAYRVEVGRVSLQSGACRPKDPNQVSLEPEVAMSSLSRPLAGAQMVFDLGDQIAELRGDEAYVRSGRVGRTLVKSGRLRLTLTLLADGIEVGTHHAETPMTLHVLEGGLRYRVDDDEFELRQGKLLFFGPGHARDIRAIGDTALLLTITGDDRA